MISEELLQQWLDALETCMQVDQQWQIFDADKVRVATKSLRAAIAQPESDPFKPDAMTVNFMRLAGLDKHKARECADIAVRVLAQAKPEVSQAHNQETAQ